MILLQRVVNLSINHSLVFESGVLIHTDILLIEEKLNKILKLKIDNSQFSSTGNNFPVLIVFRDGENNNELLKLIHGREKLRLYCRDEGELTYSVLGPQNYIFDN